MPAISPAAAHHRARIAGLTRAGVPPDDPRYDEARRNLRTQVIIDRTDRLLAELSESLRPVRVGPGGGDAA